MNALNDQTSPYLRQHADNPVEWYPWGEPALELARKLDKPILLSIGYSACHWCHVMADESFQNPSIAGLMNEFFVCIKVDREERPDLDRIYQTAHLFLTQNSGGWPLTMFLTPEQQPFFGGTYFPVTASQETPAFADILQRVNDYFQSQRPQIGQQNQALHQAMLRSEASETATAEQINQQPLQQIASVLTENYDSHNGGFGGAPKFPHVPSLELCLRLARSNPVPGEDPFLNMALLSLDKMVEGGIYDQISGGFFRYATDSQWQIPHFEKMLYDNGLLLTLLSQACITSGSGRYHRVIEQTGRWVIDEMQSPAGGYYSSLDADSRPAANGSNHNNKLIEGAYYTFKPEQAQKLLSDEQWQVISRRFGLDQAANFNSQWHLTGHQSIAQIASELRLSSKRVVVVLTGAMQQLEAARQNRPHPARDEKTITAWNGLMIRGMAMAGRETGKTEFIESAERALNYLRQHHWQDGRLRACSFDGKAELNGYLDDYVMVMDGILALQQCRWDSTEFEFLLALAERLLSHFQAVDDSGSGNGLYFTSDDHQQLILRNRPFADDSLPAGNAVAVRVFGQLSQLTGDPRYRDLQQRIFAGSWQLINEMPMAHCGLLAGLQDYLDPPTTVIARATDEASPKWQAQLRSQLGLRSYSVTIPAAIDSLPGLLNDKTMIDTADGLAYLCKGFSCSAPITELDQLTLALQLS